MWDLKYSCEVEVRVLYFGDCWEGSLWEDVYIFFLVIDFNFWGRVNLRAFLMLIDFIF